MFEEYPKKITLINSVGVTLRPMNHDDQYALYSFSINLGAEDRRFLRNVVTDRKLIRQKWARNLNYNNVVLILAE